MLFTDKVTIYTHKKITETVGEITSETDTWERTVIDGVQWADSYEKQNNGGKIDVARYASVTFPEGTFENIILEPGREEDAIVYGEVEDEVTNQRGQRLSDLLNKYPKSGRIKTVNNNSNRTFLKNKKVVIA